MPDLTEPVRELHELMAQAAANPGKPVAIPADLSARLMAEHVADNRPAIEAIRRRERRGLDALRTALEELKK